MYVFTPEEKTSLRLLVTPFIMRGQYKSNDILQRIDEGKLTKRDLTSIQNKLSLIIQGMGHSVTTAIADPDTTREVAAQVAIMDNALSRYRIISWK
ncbi:MAG: hypothetical protein PHI98_13385 [Eubacteriales bacterium]|nr:hypothetical protein [Eubacteriales bacterium]